MVILVKLYKYVNDNGLCIFLDSKNSKLFNFGKYKCDFTRTDDFICVFDNDVEYSERMDQIKYGLYKIEDNIDVLCNIIDKVNSFVLYEEYQKVNGNLCNLNWTDNSNSNNLTGNKVLCYPLFYGYKLDKGCIISDYVENLFEIKDEYGYIKNDFYSYVNVSLNDELKLSRNKKNN